jgi:hypothetical protein
MSNELTLARDNSSCTAAEVTELKRAVKLRDAEMARMDQELKKIHERLYQ